MSVDLVGSLAGLEALAPEWEALHRADPRATLFQSPACGLAWARTHAADRVFAAAVREEGRLTGLLPLFTWEGAALLAGTGPTDFNDGAFAPDAPEAAALALAAGCAEARRRGADRVELRQLRPVSALLAAPAPRGWSDEPGEDETCPVSPLTGTDGLGAMLAKPRKKLDYTRRKAERAGGWTVEVADAAGVGAALDVLFDLHARRWALEGEPGVLGDPLMQGFLRDAAPGWRAEGSLRLRTLRLADGAPAAVLLALQDAAAVHMYLTGFDPAHVALGPGTLLIAETLEGAAREGCGEARWLRGREPYKYGWGAVDAPTLRRTLRPL